MGDPVTAIAVGTTIIGGLFEADAKHSQANAQARGYDGQAWAADRNALIAGEQARDSVLRGGQEEGRLRRQGRQFLGSQRAALGASGIASDSGSAADLQLDTLMGIEEDAAAIRLNAQREAWGHQVNQFNYKAQARQYREAARASRKAGNQAFGGTLLGTAAKTALML